MARVNQEATIIASGGRDGSLLLHDLRCKSSTEITSGDSSPNSIIGEYQFSQQTFSPSGSCFNLGINKRRVTAPSKLTLQKPSVNGLAFLSDFNLAACESTSERVSFFDLRMLGIPPHLRIKTKSQQIKDSLVTSIDKEFYGGGGGSKKSAS